MTFEKLYYICKRKGGCMGSDSRKRGTLFFAGAAAAYLYYRNTYGNLEKKNHQKI